MILHITFTDGSNPWVSLPNSREMIMKLWQKWSKVPTAKPMFKVGNLKCMKDCIGNWYVSPYFDGMYSCKEFKYLASALKYMEKEASR